MFNTKAKKIMQIIDKQIEQEAKLVQMYIDELRQIKPGNTVGDAIRSMTDRDHWLKAIELGNERIDALCRLRDAIKRKKKEV